MGATKRGTNSASQWLILHIVKFCAICYNIRVDIPKNICNLEADLIAYGII
jgi:hypothetical protein